MITTEIDTRQADAAFARLERAGVAMRPLMQQLGELLAETTKQRFQTSTGPDGQRWAPNAESTYVQLLGKFKGSTGRDGRINQAGAKRMAGKKPLIGETRALSTTIAYDAGNDFLELGSPMAYAAVQQYGAKARSFSGGKTPWGDIPARPFLGLSDDDQVAIVQTAEGYLVAVAVGGR